MTDQAPPTPVVPALHPEWDAEHLTSSEAVRADMTAVKAALGVETTALDAKLDRLIDAYPNKVLPLRTERDDLKARNTDLERLLVEEKKLQAAFG